MKSRQDKDKYNIGRNVRKFRLARIRVEELRSLAEIFGVEVAGFFGNIRLH